MKLTRFLAVPPVLPKAELGEKLSVEGSTDF